MTDLFRTRKNFNKISFKGRSVFSVFIVLISLFIATALPRYVQAFVKSGLLLCFNVIIPSLFPFMLITDLIVCFFNINEKGILAKAFEGLFKINKSGISAYISGIICGFPLGVRSAVDLYKKGAVSKEECERLIGFANNTGPAFLISGIGYAMRQSVKDGIILYISMLLSSLIVGILSGIRKKPSHTYTVCERKAYSFTGSVQGAMLGTLNVSAFVILFSVITGFISVIARAHPVALIILPLLEVSNAARTISEVNTISYPLSLALTSFAVSFSGICVHLQAKSFIRDTDVSMRCYYPEKVMQGLISALISMIIAFIT